VACANVSEQAIRVKANITTEFDRILPPAKFA
jgi:hypothetical protein